MAYDLDQFSTNSTQKTTLDNDTGGIKIKSNTWMGTAWETIKAAIRFKVTKMLLFLIFTAVVFIISGDFQKSKNVADDMSAKGANEDYIGLFGVFAKETGHKSPKLNMHPFYHTKGVRELEAKYKVDFGRDLKFSKVFAYVIYEDQDFMVMKSAARGSNKVKLKLEYSTFIGNSADDHCEDYFEGYVPDEEMEKIFVKLSWRIRKIKNAPDQDEKMFRCMIDPDVIEDYLEDDNEN